MNQQHQAGVTAFPLAWPLGWARAKRRERAGFSTNGQRLSVGDGRDRLTAELARLGAKFIVISSNLELRNDGQPRGTSRQPDDPGVAVYFSLSGQSRCMPCDKWDRAADNLAAIAKHVESVRGQLRWGVGTVDAAFAGFKALPGGSSGEAIVSPPPMTPREAADVVARYAQGVPATAVLSGPNGYTVGYHQAAKVAHPDRGGTAAAWSELQRAASVLQRHHGLPVQS